MISIVTRKVDQFMELLRDYRGKRLSVALILCGIVTILLNIPIFEYYKYTTLDVLINFPLYVLALSAWYIGRPLLAVHQWYRTNRTQTVVLDDNPSVSVLIPAYNESHGITETVESVLEQTYDGEIEIVITDDGSTDNTLEIIEWLSKTYNNIVVVSQDNAGSGVARNTSLANATNEIVLSLDADTILDEGAIENMIRQFDDDVVAVGGNVNVRNDDGIVAKSQLFDYGLSFSIARMFQSRLNHVLCLSGSCSAFRREVLEDIGGWVTDPKYADDFELSIRISEKGRINFAQKAIAHTEAPTTIRGLWKQRTWWAQLGINTMFLHWKSNFNPSYGAMGLIGLPLKAGLTVGAVYQIFQFGTQIIRSASGALDVIAATTVFAFISTTAFSLLMVMFMVLIAVNKKPLENVRYLILYFTVYRVFHMLARLNGITKALLKEFRDLFWKLPIARSH